MKYALAGVAALAAAALIVGIMALSGGPVPDEAAGPDPEAALQAELDALEAEVAGLVEARQRLLARSQELEARLRELDDRLKEAETRPAGQEAEAVRRELLEAGGELPVRPEELPAPVREAVEQTIPGLELTRCEERIRNDRRQFQLEGRLAGDDEEYELEISPDGEVLEADLPPALVPAPLREAAIRALGGLELTTAGLDRNDGLLVYRFEGEEDGEEYMVEMTAAGQVVDGDLPVRAVPAEVLAAGRAAVPGFEVLEVDRDRDNGKLVYELKGRAGGRRCRVKVDDAGQVVRAYFSPSLLPPAVLAAAERAAPGLRPRDEAQLRWRDGRRFYELEGRVGRRDVELWIAPDGELLRAEGLEDEAEEPEEPEAAPAPPPAPGAEDAEAL